MIVEDLYYEKIYPEMKQYVETNSIYSPIVTKKYTTQSKQFPIVPSKLLPVTNQYNNLSYGEETYTFGIDVNVYSTDKTINGKKISGETICKEVTDKVVEYFKTNYYVTIKVELAVINVDSSVHRNNIKITGKLDTKYGLDNLVIYPN